LEIIFWILFLIVFYTFAGYALLLTILLFFKRLFSDRKKYEVTGIDSLPRVCMFVTAYNEADYVDMKVNNMLELDYPIENMQFLWITDGSEDGTPDILKKYPRMEVHHLPKRNGKIHAMNRGMQFVDASIVIFSDSNTKLCREAVKIIVSTFDDPNVGCIAGEKRVISKGTDNAAGSGENLYWKFESWVKQMDSDLNSAVGAVGELFAIRTQLFEEVENDTILDDFIISLRIAEKGFRIVYTPGAFAVETASANVSEELKRKVRIAAGGLQALVRLKNLLNPFRHGLLSFQYISHKVLRWTIAPIALFLLPLINLFILLEEREVNNLQFYSYFLYFQVFLYLMALFGWLLENRKIRFKLLFVPYYFTAINYASILGWLRFLKGKQSVNWEKAKRA
jgi:cellulose synthase/poly-beta-1,6-N-acetylglucosamine synthase-like glycosyltransferase